MQRKFLSLTAILLALLQILLGFINNSGYRNQLLRTPSRKLRIVSCHPSWEQRHQRPLEQICPWLLTFPLLWKLKFHEVLGQDNTAR